MKRKISRQGLYEGFAQIIYDLNIEILEWTYPKYRIMMLFASTLRDLKHPLLKQSKI